MGDGQRQKVRNMNNIERTTTGKIQFVINQDRNQIYPLCLKNLHSSVKEEDGVFFGINLYMEYASESILLGTFDTLEEIMDEINALYNTNEEIYCVTGFNPGIIQTI